MMVPVIHNQSISFKNCFGLWGLLFINYLLCNEQDYCKDKLIKRTNILDLMTRNELIIYSYIVSIVMSIVLFLIMPIYSSIGYLLSFFSLTFFAQKLLKENNDNNFLLDFFLLIPLLVELSKNKIILSSFYP